MRNIWVIAKREYSLYFISPVAYAILFMIMLILGIIFYFNVLAAMLNQFTPDIQFVINPLVTMLLFTTPAITMRTIAEEQKQGTLETLLTAPLHDAELVMGKWLGTLLFGTTVILITLIYPILLNFMVKPGLDMGLVLSNYLGVFLLTCGFFAVGVFASSLFSNQIAAFFVTLGILLVFWTISFPTQLSSPTTFSEVLTYLDFSRHFYSSFNTGLIGLKDIVYLLSISGFSLYVASVVIESKRWH